MTTKNWKKVFKQLKVKPAKLKKYIKHNSPRPRKDGYSIYRCERCGRAGGYINKYRLGLCRCCFKEIAPDIGFKKYS
ncbi:30S ribosomal protein S14 [Candidatus Woesearchaeota archaeon]|nr:30S ribosomal protein S14 [Candidatus Woesearchaeota archaeon]